MLITEWRFALPDYRILQIGQWLSRFFSFTLGMRKLWVWPRFYANIAPEDRHLKKLKVEEKLQALKSERGEENPIKLESAKKLTSPARFGSCIFASVAPSHSWAGKQARKSRLKLHPGDGARSLVCSFSSLSLLLDMAKGRSGGTCRRGNNTVENSAP